MAYICIGLKERLRQVISPDDALAVSIFGTTDINAIHNLLNSYCQKQFDHEVIICTFACLSVGATFVVELSDCQTIVIKAYSLHQFLPSLRASFKVQQALANAGFPCPSVLQLPQQAGSTILTAQVFCSGSPARNRSSLEQNLLHRQRSPLDAMTHIRRTMARCLAQLIEQSKRYSQKDLPVWMALDQSNLWHQPHNVLFDFEKTRAGAEWIDDIAQQTKEGLRAATGPQVISHSDWSLQNMSFCEGELRCVYDWDSLRVGLEPCFVGGAARVYRHDWRIGPPEPAISVSEVQDFVTAYEIARGQPFTDEEYGVLGASIVYTTAYGTRCAHAVQKPDDAHYARTKHQLKLFANVFLSST